jgi:hypothetical protein
MKRDGVSVALDLVLEEIAAVEAQLKHEGIAAFETSRYADTERLSEAGKNLELFAQKLSDLKEAWTSGIDENTRHRIKVHPGGQVRSHKKGPRQNLRITLPTGRVIQRPTAAAALVDAIEALGVDHVKSLNLKVGGVPLVGTERHEKYGQSTLGDFLICTHSSTPDKKKLLERIAKELERPVTVEVIPS